MSRLLSVVVIGRNEGERLRRCLESVTAMERGGWRVEVIYVDSDSSDGSVGLAESLGAKTIALNPLRPTAALARNAGWRAAAGEVVFFLDGDTVVEAEFFEGAVGEFDEGSVGVVWGHRREMHPERSVYNRVLDLDWVYVAGKTGFCGGDALFRREALERAGGFDEGLIAGEEPELCRRLTAQRWVILHVDRAMTMHDLAMMEFGQYWRRATRAGHAFAEVSERFRGSEEPFWSEDVARNRHRAVAQVVVFGMAIVVSGWMRTWWPVVGLGLGFGVLVGRTAWRARWKAPGKWGTLVLYGVHSWVQQVPIFVGQMRYRWNRRRGVRAGLVEYKRP